MNYSDILIPERSLPNRVVNIAIILGASWIIAISAQITINLPFSPVPITGQTLAVLLAGLILGKNLGAASVAAYLAQGAAGLPFFAGGKSGLATLFGPTGGYLFGFLAAVYIVGMLSELRFKRSLYPGVQRHNHWQRHHLYIRSGLAGPLCRRIPGSSIGLLSFLDRRFAENPLRHCPGGWQQRLILSK